MHLNEEEFTEQFSEAIDGVLVNMAEAPEIDLNRFFSMVCILENLQYFGPVIYGAIRKPETN